MIVLGVCNYKGDKCLDEKSQYYDIVNRGDRAYSGVGRTKSGLAVQGGPVRKGGTSGEPWGLRWS